MDTDKNEYEEGKQINRWNSVRNEKIKYERKELMMKEVEIFAPLHGMQPVWEEAEVEVIITTLCYEATPSVMVNDGGQYV
jgi:hypothetical protein